MVDCFVMCAQICMLQGRIGEIESETDIERTTDDERDLLVTGYRATERIGHVASRRHLRAGVELGSVWRERRFCRGADPAPRVPLAQIEGAGEFGTCGSQSLRPAPTISGNW